MYILLLLMMMMMNTIFAYLAYYDDERIIMSRIIEIASIHAADLLFYVCR